ncbi:14416_t:CDS:2, partial [Ambispora leptoticha]
MPDWKNLLGIDKKHEKKPNKDTFDNITHENTPPPKKTNNNNEGGNLVTVVKTITTTDANGNKTTKTITYTTTEPVDSFEPETITFEHPPLEDGVSIENLLDQELKHHPHNEDDKENILPVVETHPKHHNHEEKSKISQIVTKDFVEHYNAAEHDYSKVDHHARTTPSSKTKDVPTLSHHLTSPFKETDEKLRAIFTWIAENIVYDVDALFSGNIHHMDATQVLHKRLA